jgi:hypothetical protein
MEVKLRGCPLSGAVTGSAVMLISGSVEKIPAGSADRDQKDK